MSTSTIVGADEIMTSSETGMRLRTSEETLKYWRQKKCGPAYFKLGSRVMYRRCDVDAFIEAQLAAAEAS